MKVFEKYHPIVLMIYFLSILATTMFQWNPVIQLTALLGSILFCASLQKRRELLMAAAFYIPLFLMVAVTNPLFSHNGVTPLFFLNGNPVTMEAFAYGIAIGVMVIGVMLWCRCYSEIMTSDKFLYLFGRVIPKLSLILSMALRYIPLFKRQLHKVSRAQKAMGLYTSKSYMDKAKSACRVFSVLVTWSLENAIDTSMSMRARGYGIKGRTNYANFHFSKADGMMLCFIILTDLITIGGALFGVTDFYYYPRISEPDTSFPAMAVYISYGLLAILPFILEMKENLKWKYYVSKI